MNSGSRIVPMDSVPDKVECKASAPWRNSVMLSRTRSAKGSSLAPSSVNTIPVAVRVNNCSPRVDCRAFNCRLTAGCVRCSRPAARVKLPSAAMATKARSWVMSMVGLPD